MMVKKEQSVSPKEAENTVAEAEHVNTTEFPTVVAVEPEYTEKQTETAVPVKKKRGLFKRREKPAEKPFVIEEDTAWESAAEEDTVKVYGETVSDDTREITVSQTTRVLDEDDDADVDRDQATQLMLDGFESEEQSDKGASEELRRIRQEKIQDFSQKREEHERAEAEQAEQSVDRGEVVYPEMLQEKPKAIAKDEFTAYQQPGVVRQKLQTASRKAGASLFVIALAEIVAFFMAVISFVSPSVSMNPTAYLIVHLLLLGVMMLAARSRLRVGLSRLFSGSATAESGVALTAVVTVIHTALQFLNPTGVTDGTTPLLTAVSGLSLLLMQVADKLETDRVSRTFGVIAAQGEKWTAKRIEDSSLAEEIGRPAVALGEPRVCYFRKTAFCADYVTNSQDEQCAHGLMRWYMPTTLALSFAVSVVYLLINGLTTWFFAVALFCSMVSISSPILLLLYLRAALVATGKDLAANGTAIVGYEAIREYGSCHAVALDAIDLFPENAVLLHGIKTFSGTRIDEAILDAASVSVRAGGPLSHMFRRMILNKVDMLHDVDTLVYEQDMGLSGWVNGRRVLIGNRKLLDNHGIDIPSKDYEERYAKGGRQLVYLSIAGELSAMFVVSYVASPTVQKILTDLTHRRITLLVRTCDPNVTEALIASTFGLNGFYVELLGAPAGRSFEALVDGVSAAEPAGVVSTGGIGAMMSALAKCRRLRTGVRIFTAVQAVLGILGMVIVAGMTFFGGILIPSLYAVEFLGIAALVSAGAAFGFAKS